MKSSSWIYIPWYTFINVCFASLAFPSIANPFTVGEEIISQEKNNISVSLGPENILQSKEPLPVNDRILSLLSLAQQKSIKNITRVEAVLLQLEEINSSFNAAEQYLILFIKGLVEHTSHNENQAISWFEKSLTLRNNIPDKQKVLPEFSEVFLVLATAYANHGEFKKAFDSKEKFIGNGSIYFKETRAQKIKELNKTYATDHKVKQNELLANQNKIKRLKIIAAENKKFSQQRNISILVITVIVFFLLLLRQIKVRKKLKYLAKTDSLTNLYNRRTLFKKGTETVEKAINEQQSLSVILLDVDFFKSINDNYGHDIGDEVLKIIAKLSNETMRSRDLLARLGGEEFVGILPGVGGSEAKAIAERLREKVASKDLSALNIDGQLTVSIGVACLEQVEPNFDDLLNAADIAMYYAKANGRNRVCQFNDQWQNNTD